MSYFYTLVSVFVSAILAFHLDDPIVIERPQNKVEWGDVMLEYDPSQTPIDNHTIYVSIRIFNAKWQSEVLSLDFEMLERWTDSRLRFQEKEAKVLLPKTQHIWTPETYFVDSIRDEILREATLITNLGEVIRRERRHLEIPCTLHSNMTLCDLGIGSYSATSQPQFEYAVTEFGYTKTSILGNYLVATKMQKSLDGDKQRIAVISLQILFNQQK
ncbi:unnamed protein product, partial [Mesorhabditis belari]|uniref:Neurotransmitter-gated ion-channel ligand-binding domain-containing protein n=1 Tax=Mesorhabditis belari TaxID=2138241 RepID=A0AAF3F113_9BILA